MGFSRTSKQAPRASKGWVPKKQASVHEEPIVSPPIIVQPIVGSVSVCLPPGLVSPPGLSSPPGLELPPGLCIPPTEAEPINITHSRAELLQHKQSCMQVASKPILGSANIADEMDAFLKRITQELACVADRYCAVPIELEDEEASSTTSQYSRVHSKTPSESDLSTTATNPEDACDSPRTSSEKSLELKPERPQAGSDHSLSTEASTPVDEDHKQSEDADTFMGFKIYYSKQRSENSAHKEQMWAQAYAMGAQWMQQPALGRTPLVGGAPLFMPHQYYDER